MDAFSAEAILRLDIYTSYFKILAMDPGKINILVVDDEDILRKTLKTYLEDEGYAVVTASNGEEAVSVVKNGQVDIMIVDMHLPDMGGEELIMRSKRISGSIRYIVHTGDSNYTLPPALVEVGLSPGNILYKPIIDLNMLNAMIRDICTN